MVVSIAREKATTRQVSDLVQDSLTTAFGRDGFVGPFRLFTIAECRSIVSRLKDERRPSPAVWDKGLAVSDRFFYEIATLPHVRALVTELLGDNIVLWGCHAVKRSAGSSHPWHTDIESSASDGRSVTVWVGLENTSRESGLQLISRSHTFGRTIQQVAYENGLSRGLVSNEAIIRWAQETDRQAALVQPEMSDGQSLLFDGRLWHGSDNTGSKDRHALILQYAAADMPLRMPDFSQLDWPFRFKDRPRIPVILVRGETQDGINRLVAPPFKEDESSKLTSRIYKLSLPLAEDPVTRWKPYGIFNASTPIFEDIRCHTSVLSPGHSPHPPHSHAEEELLIPLDGEAELIISDSPSLEKARVERLRPGQFVYYPSFQHHTIYNPGTSPVTYLMFKWWGGAFGTDQSLGTSIFPFGDIAIDKSEPFNTQHIFQGPTDYLGKLHSHLSTVQPGGGYEVHVDEYDVAILMLSGRIETLGQIAEPHDVIYYSAGEPHGLRNVGDEPARYLVFEFHRPRGLANATKRPLSIIARQWVRSLLVRLNLLAEARRIVRALRRLRSGLFHTGPGR